MIRKACSKRINDSVPSIGLVTTSTVGEVNLKVSTSMIELAMLETSITQRRVPTVLGPLVSRNTTGILQYEVLPDEHIL